MSLTLYKTLAALLIFITTVAAVAYPIKTRHRPSSHHFMELGDAFASGIFLGAALFHMLPDATAGFQETLGSIHYPLSELFAASGFLLLLFLERLSLNATQQKHKMTIPYLIAITLIIHSLIEGAALGINTTLAAMSVIFLAVFFHKGSESFALSLILCRGNHLSTMQLFSIIGIFSIMTPIGIALGTTITTFLQFKQGQMLAASFNAFAAGTFLYMSTLHHINHHQRAHNAENFLEFIFLLIGVSLMGIIVLWI